MKLNAMNSIAEAYLEAVRRKLEQIAGILKNNANVVLEGCPSYEEQRKAMANPVEFQNLLGTAVIHLPDKQKIYYRFPYPLPNGAFLLKGELRTPGFCIPIAPPKEPLDLENEKSQVWAGEIYRLNGTIKWLEGYAKQNRIKVAEELQKNLMKWEPKPNVSFKSFKKYLQRPNFPLVDQTNPLSEVASIREIRFPTDPSQTDKYSPKNISERAKVHQSHLGRVCILETSDDKPGEVLYLAQGACVQIKNEESQIISKEPNHLFSYSCTLVPFIQHNKPIRAFIGGRELKQALSLLDPEIPLVCTGVEKEVAEESGRVIRARNPGKVINVNWRPQGGEIQVQRNSEGEVDHYPLAGYCHVHSGEFQGGCYYEKPRVVNPHPVRKGEILAEGCGVNDGKLALGVNLLVAWMPWFGYNFEDAIVISEHAAKLLTSVHVYEEKDERDPEEIRVKVKEEEIKYGTELTDQVRFSRHIKHGEVVRILKSQDGFKIWISEERPAEIGDKITNRHGNKGVISLILPESEMPYFDVKGEKRVIDVILNPTSVISRVNLGQILETHFGWVIHEIKCRDDLEEFRNSNELENVGAPFKEIKEEQLNQLKDLLVETGLSEYGKAEVCRTVNGEKEKLGSYVVGYQYFVKLRHLARDKLIAAGKTEKRDPWLCQPEKGNSISDFGIWALIAHKADSLAQELLTIRSDDINGSDLRPGEALKVFYPESLRLIVQYLRGLGLEVEVKVPKSINKSNFSVEKIQAVKLRAATSEEMKKWGEEMKKCDEEMKTKFLFSMNNTGIEDSLNNGTIPEVMREKLKNELKNEGVSFPKNSTVDKENSKWVIADKEKKRIYCIVKKEEGKLNIYRKEKSKYAGFVRFDETLAHPLCSDLNLSGIYEIPEAFSSYNIGDEQYELARHYRKLKKKKNLQESLRKIIEGVKVKKFSWDDVPGKENFYPRAERGILDFLKGKTGLFRDGSLGKQSDYSAMAVIVPDLELKINEISLPKVVWKELELEKDEPILAVRHPVLHRYGTLAFYPQKRDDFAIGIPPLLCKGFGADFDGDTMTVFRAISQEAQKELENLFSTCHLYSSATGELNLHLTQDFILGKLGEQIAPDEVRKSLREQFEKAISTIKEKPHHHNEQKIHNAIENEILKLQTEILGNRCQAGRNKQKDATHSGISVGIFDIQKLVNYLTNRDITEQELKNFLQEHPQNPLCLMALSKARGKKLAQLREMVGQIGMVKMSGIETDSIRANFLKGLSSDDYKIYAQFARDILYQSNRAPQDPGAAVREYYNKAGNLLITERDCGTNEGISLTKKYLLGRVPVDNNTERLCLTENDLAGKNDGYKLKVRSPLCCQSKTGICKLCYGCYLSSKEFPKFPPKDWRVGAISVQSVLENLYQDELKVIHRDPQKDWENKVSKFREALKNQNLLELQELGLNVDSRHFEVLIRAEKIRKEQGWLTRAAYGDPQNDRYGGVREIFKQALEKELEDKLKDFTSRLLLGQNPGQIPPEYSDGKWVPLADRLPPPKDTPEKPPSHKQIWSAFYLDENTAVFVKGGKQAEKLKKAINDMTWSDLVNIANNKKAQIKANIKKSDCKGYAIVGHDGIEISLQQLFEFKNQGRPEGQLHKDICEWLSTILKENLRLSFGKLAKGFKKKCPKYNNKSDDAIEKQLSTIFQEQLKKDFPAWRNTISEENLSQSTEEELVEQFKKVYPKYNKMRPNKIINIVKEHISDI